MNRTRKSICTQKDKEEDIWFHGTVFLSVWQSNQTHVGFIYMSTWYAGFKAEKTKYINTNIYYPFLWIFKPYFDSISKTSKSCAKAWQKAWNMRRCLLYRWPEMFYSSFHCLKHPKRFLTPHIITLDVLWVVKTFFCDYMAMKYVLLRNILAFRRCVSDHS